MPLLAGGLLLGGALLSGASGSQKRRAGRREARAEANRQRGFNEDRFSNFQEALQQTGSDLGPEARQAASGERQDLYRSLMPDAPTRGPTEQQAGGTSGQRMFQDLLLGERQGAREYTDNRGKHRADIAGFTQALQDQQYNMQPHLRKDRRVHDQALVSGGLSPAEVQQAYDGAGNFLGLAGNAMSTIGSMGMYNAGNSGDLSGLFRGN